MKSAFNRSILALAAIVVVAGASQANAQDKPLKKYESGTKEFWTHPPDDWFLGDETEAQKDLAPPSGPPTGSSEAELAAMMKKIKLPPGFKIEVYAPGVLQARQMAWGDKGTHRPAYRRSAASTPRPAMPKSGRSASATASAAMSIRAPASTGSPRMPATGSATICRATSST
jgi:hypothetical protein